MFLCALKLHRVIAVFIALQRFVHVRCTIFLSIDILILHVLCHSFDVIYIFAVLFLLAFYDTTNY